MIASVSKSGFQTNLLLTLGNVDEGATISYKVVRWATDSVGMRSHRGRPQPNSTPRQHTALV